MTTLLILIMALLISACGERESKPIEAPSKSCRGKFTVTDQNGLVRKRYDEKLMSGKCTLGQDDLTQWDKSSITRFEHQVKCTPQTDLPTMWIRSANNYYAYRNSRIFIELNSATGEARRLVIGEMPDGRPSFNRQVFCYYLRTDNEVEPTNSYSYGSMLQFDLELAGSSSIFSPQELYNYQLVGNEFRLQKMDDNSFLDWQWCPTNTPIGFCDFLRNFNDFYFPPDPSDGVQAQLKAEAILIRSELNTIKISQHEFSSAWNTSIASGIEVGTSDYVKAGGKWKYLVNAIWDEPLFVGRAIRNYMRREPLHPFMPDLVWASSMGMPHVCYSAKKEVTLVDGSTAWIDGEACYDGDGKYTFSQ